MALWAVTGISAMPLMSAAECAEMAQGASCDRSQHHAAMPHHTTKQNPTSQHDCCKKKTKTKPAPTQSSMPGCPMHEGLLPRTCGMAEVTCCALVGREETARRTAKPEKSKGSDSPDLLMAKAQPGLMPEMFDRRDRHLEGKLRYERPVFDLKTDMRI